MVYDPNDMRPVVRNAFWLGIGEAAVKGGLVLATVLIARSNGPVGVGTFSVAYSAAMTVILILAIGQQEVLIREVARSPGGARGLLSVAQVVQSRLAWWFVPAAAVAALLVGNRELRLALLAFLPYALLRTATVTIGAAFKGLDRMDVEVRARGVEVGIALALIAVGAAAGWPAWTAGIAFSIGSAIGLVWLFTRSTELTDAGSAVTATTLLREGLPFMLLAVVSQLLTHSDRFLLAGLGVQTAEIGLWGAAGTIAWALLAIPQLVALAAYPSLSRMAEGGHLPRRPGLAASMAGATTGLVCAFVLQWVAEPLVMVSFGRDFALAVPLLQRLAWALPGAFALMSMGSVFAAWRRQRVSLWNMVGALALSVGLNLSWIPSKGVVAPSLVAPIVYTLAAVVASAILVGLKPGQLGTD